MTEPDGQNERQRQQAVRLTVAKDGSGDYDTVGAALEALGDKEGPPACIFIKEGVYRERLEIRRPGSHIGGPVSRRHRHYRWTVCRNDHGRTEVSGGPFGLTACW